MLGADGGRGVIMEEMGRQSKWLGIGPKVETSGFRWGCIGGL